MGHRRASFAVTRLVLIAVAVSSAACAGTLRPPSLSPRPAEDALLVLPGLGFGDSGERVLRALAPQMAREGVDLFVPEYLTRSGFASSRRKLERFIRDAHLDRYRRLHIFAFLAGAWTVNPLITARKPPNLASVIYARSPYQERAAAVAVRRYPMLVWLRYGSTIFELARTPYPPLDIPGVYVAVIVESRPTPFIRRHEKAARAHGPFEFDCRKLAQRYDDCGYLPVNHDEMYARFADVWPEVLAFIRTSRLTSAVDRTFPTDDAFSVNRPR